MVRQWQSLYYGQRYSATVLDDQLDFVKCWQRPMGAVGMRVTKKRRSSSGAGEGHCIRPSGGSGVRHRQR